MNKIHSFNVEAATHLGLSEAIVLQCLATWMDSQSEFNDAIKWEGNLWLRLTLKQIHGSLPYLTPFKIKAALDILEQVKLIKVTNEYLAEGLARRKFMYYSLTERGYDLTHEEVPHEQS